ncbi:hypothetical protein D9M71_736750 [compost metagenome]
MGGVFKGASGLLTGGLLAGGLGGSEGQQSNSALEAALAAQRQAAQNAQVDLSVENVPTIDTGGTAEGQAEAGNKARRRRTGGLASSLGINVG